MLVEAEDSMNCQMKEGMRIMWDLLYNQKSATVSKIKSKHDVDMSNFPYEWTSNIDS